MKQSAELFEMAHGLLDAMTTNHGNEHSESLKITVSVAMELVVELALCMQFSNNMYGVVVNVHPAEVFKVMHQELIMFNEGNQLK